MLRIALRVLAVLALLAGLLASAVAGYLLLTPSDEETAYEQKYREMNEKYKQAQTARDSAERARLLKESEEAAGSAKVWAEGARTRRTWHIAGVSVGVALVFVSLVVFLLTFIGRRKTVALTA
jgi:aromatic ring hydroxylase